MQIYLLRHGIAADADPGGEDAERALLPEGKRKLRALLERARKAGVRPGLVLTSPYVRARQTAEIARRTLSAGVMVAPAKSLAPGATAAQAWDEIRLYANQEQILCSTHEPLCSLLAGYLLGTPELTIDFKKGALMRIDVEGSGPRPRGILKWMLAPRLA